MLSYLLVTLSMKWLFTKNDGQCRNIATRMLRFDGDPKMYSNESTTKAVIVGFCAKHVKNLKNAGLDIDLEAYTR